MTTKILISTDGSHGDVLPFIALGRRLRERGAEVVFFSNPRFAASVAAAGLRFVPVGAAADHARLFGGPPPSDQRRAMGRVLAHFAAMSAAHYRAMRAELLPGQTRSVCCSLLFGARLLRETDGVPCSVVHLAPSVFCSDDAPARLAPRWVDADTPRPLRRAAQWALGRWYYRGHFVGPLNRFRAELGLAPVDEVFRHAIHDADVLVGMFPEWFAPRQADWPQRLRLTGFPLYDDGAHAPLPPALDAFLDAGERPVAFTAGTASADPRAFFETCAAVCRRTGVRGVLVGGAPTPAVEPLSPRVVRVAWAPFGALLPRVAAFVHHGGIGTTSQALRAGVPQLLRPVAYDQFDNAARTVKLGVGRELLAPRFTAWDAAEALRRLLRDELLQRRCRQLAARLADVDAVAATCDAILGADAPASNDPPLPRLAGGR